MRRKGETSMTTRIGRLLAATAVSLVMCGCAGMSGTGQGGTDDQNLRVWPKASAPAVYKASNGDRVGEYPPYTYPCH